MIKNLYCCFCTKTQYSTILIYRVVGEKGIKGVYQGNAMKLLKYL